MKINERVRKYLIDAVRSNKKFAYYSDLTNNCGLNLNLSEVSDRNILSNILGDISAFELSNKRPLLSSVAIYKDVNKNDHGDGFYKICEHLGLGKASKLKTDLFGFAEAERCREFWMSEEYYPSLYDLVVPISQNIKKVNFFNANEISVLTKWALKVYNPKNVDHIAAKNFLMETVWEKTVYLGNSLIEKLDGFDIKNGKYWSQPGWDLSGEKSRQAAIFKPYTWVRIFKKGDKLKDIFFTVGLDAQHQSFVYKLDYFFEKESNLSNEQKELCKALIPDELAWREIPFKDLFQLDWDQLIERTYNFINSNIPIYNSITKSVWNNKIPITIPNNRLIKRNRPKDGLTKLPVLNPGFEGVEVDYNSKNEESSMLGSAGEKLVIEYEKRSLIYIDRPDLALMVKKVLDGKGYDILSFDEQGNEKYIEVKTTTGNSNAPFYLSLNELLFIRKKVKNYFLYRLYNYNKVKNTSEFYVFEGRIEDKLLLQPIEFKVYKRDEND